MLYLLFQKRKCKNCGKLSHKDVLSVGCVAVHLIIGSAFPATKIRPGFGTV